MEATDSSGSTEAPSGASDVADMYERFVGDVASLQHDLSLTVAACKRLREENAALRRHYEELKETARRTHDKLQDTKQQCLQEAQARVGARLVVGAHSGLLGGGGRG